MRTICFTSEGKSYGIPFAQSPLPDTIVTVKGLYPDVVILDKLSEDFNGNWMDVLGYTALELKESLT